MTRGGVTYHFPQREALVRAVAESFAADLEQNLQARIDVPYGQSTPLVRARAYLEASARPDGVFLYGFVTDPEVRPLVPNPFDLALRRWLPAPPDGSAGTDDRAAFVLGVLAHGISAYRALLGEDMGEDARNLLLQEMDQTLDR